MVLQENLVEFDNRAEAVVATAAEVESGARHASGQWSAKEVAAVEEEEVAAAAAEEAAAATKQTLARVQVGCTETKEKIAIRETFQNMGLRCQKSVAEHLLLKNATTATCCPTFPM